MQEGIVGNYAEQLALETVIKPSIQESAALCIHPNHGVTLRDGKTRFIDFAIVTKTSRIAIEIDGYAYHAEGAITRQEFNDQLSRQNELVMNGWTVLRFSFDQIKNSPEKCQDQLRRSLIDDDELHRNFSRHNTTPTAIQLEALSALQKCRDNGQKKGLVALPTGTGKTILSALDAKRVGGRVLFVAHNNEILRQAANAYRRVFQDPSIGFINSSEDHNPDRDLVFANIASLRSGGRLQKLSKNHFGYIVIDEFHHGAAPSYKELLTYFEPDFLVGLTATPERTDKKDVVALLDGNLVYQTTSSEAISRGFLVPFTYYGLKDDIDYTQIRHNGYRYDIGDLEKLLLVPKRDEAIVEKYLDLSPNAKAIGFCVSIKHADRMAAVFSEKGIPSTSIHSGLTKDERAERILKFETGGVLCAFTRDLFNEGVDVPDTDALLFLRPTESKIIFTQQLGRGLRISPGKKCVRVLDFIGNYKGAEDIPGFIHSMASQGDEADAAPREKPEYIYDNGCKISFADEIIENLVLQNQFHHSPAYFFEKIASKSDKLDRPLTPIDLFMLLSDAMAPTVAACGDYAGFVKRINEIDGDLEIIDEAFAEAEFMRSANMCDMPLDWADSLQLISIQLERLIDIMMCMPKKCSYERAVNIVWDAHDVCAELVKLLSPLCMIRNNIKIHESEAGIPSKIIDLFDVSSCVNFFSFLSSNSIRRDSFAQTNYLRSEGAFILAIPGSLAADGDVEEVTIKLLDRLLENKSLTWLMDFYDLTSYRSIDT
jgi:superfamily II DNA or RNA helicase